LAAPGCQSWAKGWPEVLAGCQETWRQVESPSDGSRGPVEGLVWGEVPEAEAFVQIDIKS